MEKRKRVAAVVVGLLLVSAAGWMLWRHWSPGGERIEATGTIEATTVELNVNRREQSKLSC